jgi:hypothetical protein
VRIHNWVASTLQWQPTWGAIQGAQGTLESLRGNASRGLNEGGRISKVRMEHIWVNAYVNWVPGKGSRAGGAAIPTASNAGTTLTTAGGHIQHPNPNAALNAWVPTVRFGIAALHLVEKHHAKN